MNINEASIPAEHFTIVWNNGKSHCTVTILAKHANMLFAEWGVPADADSVMIFADVDESKNQMRIIKQDDPKRGRVVLGRRPGAYLCHPGSRKAACHPWLKNLPPSENINLTAWIEGKVLVIQLSSEEFKVPDIKNIWQALQCIEAGYQWIRNNATLKVVK